jgi:ABC-type oligopeptide transport system substrate-binding subunit
VDPDAEDATETAFLLDDIAAAEAIDTRTLQVRLREPRNYFLHLLSQPYFYAWPRHVYERLGPRWFEAAPLVGNGPFVLGELGEQQATLEASEAWSGPRGNVRSIHLELIRGSADAAVAGWQERRYDVLPLAIGTGTTFDNAVVESAPGLHTTYLAFRTDREPWGDVRVRRAVAHAFDRERLLAAWGVAADPATRGGFIPPAMPGHSHRVAPAYDPERARALLAEAGYFRARRDPVVIVEIETTARLGADLVAQLDEVGDIARLPETDAWLTGWVADYPNPDGMLRAFVAAHRGVLRDPGTDHALERARPLSNRDERLALYREAERSWLGEQVALVPLAYGRQLSVRRPWIDGLWANPFTAATLDEAVVRRPQA